jgi:hypothetical protein
VEKQRFGRIFSGFFAAGTLKGHKNRGFDRSHISEGRF